MYQYRDLTGRSRSAKVKAFQVGSKKKTSGEGQRCKRDFDKALSFLIEVEDKWLVEQRKEPKGGATCHCHCRLPNSAFRQVRAFCFLGFPNAGLDRISATDRTLLQSRDRGVGCIHLSWAGR
jgi:hypothetical protein